MADAAPPLGDSPDDSGMDKAGINRGPPKIGWRGRLATALAGAAGGIAINDFSGTLGYRGLAGVSAVMAVLAATTWIRALDARGWLPRRASWLFLMPALASATVAAFGTGQVAGIFTSIAVTLTLGAILLSGTFKVAIFFAMGVAIIGGGYRSLDWVQRAWLTGIF